MARNYPRAVAQAVSERGLPESSFLPQPPFTLDEVLGA
jgi:hypothetical protein